MKLIITILEDIAIERERISELLDDWSHEMNTEIEKRFFNTGENYLAASNLSTEDSNLFILDIQMNKITGIDIATELRKNGYTGHIIFLTAFREYVFRGYEVHALNYLLKPVDKKSLFLCLNEVAETLKERSYLFRTKQDTINIPYRNILCFSSERHSINILTENGLFTQYAALNSIIGFLPNEFLQVHKSHIVNLAHVYKISGNTITLSNHMTVEIGPSYLKQVYLYFANYSSRFDSAPN